MKMNNLGRISIISLLLNSNHSVRQHTAHTRFKKQEINQHQDQIESTGAHHHTGEVSIRFLMIQHSAIFPM